MPQNQKTDSEEYAIRNIINMTDKLKYHKNHTEFTKPYQLVLPLNLKGLIPDDDSVQLLRQELEDLDYSLLYQAYSAKGENPAINPKVLVIS